METEINQPTPISQRTEEIKLIFGKVVSCRMLAIGRNAAQFITLDNGEQAIYKAKLNEEPNLKDTIAAGTYYKRERAGYLVSKILGFGLVPVTVIRNFPERGGIGSVQRFISGGELGFEANRREVKNNSKLQQELLKLLVFDYIVWNSDRNDENFLIKGDSVFAIDNGLCFGHDDLVMRQTDYMASEVELNSEFKEWLSGLTEANLDKLSKELITEDLLSENGIEMCIKRARLIKSKLENQERIAVADILSYSHTGDEIS